MSKKIKRNKILFTGGGTAGHIIPIVAVVREIRRLGFEIDFFYLGPRDEFGSILLSQENIKIKTILAGKIRRYWNFKSTLQNIFDVLFKIPLGFWQSFFYIFFLMPDLIFSKGGYGALTSVFCGWLLQIPIFLHESDAAPGLANRFLSRLSQQVFVAFPAAQTEYFNPEKIISVGNPIRREILAGSKEEAKKIFNLQGGRPLILIWGGSQGSQRINEMLLNILPEMLTDFELIHQTGENNLEQVRTEAKTVIPQELKKYYHTTGFLKELEMQDVLKACDLVVSRAGSGSIFEIAACGKPAILIPLANSAQDHQVKNAYAYAENGAALVMEEANLTPHFFLEKVRALLSYPQEQEKMRQEAAAFSQPESARVLAEYLTSYIKR